MLFRGENIFTSKCRFTREFLVEEMLLDNILREYTHEFHVLMWL